MLQMVNPSKSLYSTEQAVQWLTEIGEALQYMHTLTPAVSQQSHPDDFLITPVSPQLLPGLPSKLSG